MDKNNNIKDIEKSGSPEKSEPLLLTVGHLMRPHGINGEIKMKVLTQFPDRISMGQDVFVGEKREILTIESLRWQNKIILVKFSGLDDRDSVGVYINSKVNIVGESLPELPEDENYYHDLIGSKVFDENEVFLGELTEIIETGANDVYVVTDEQKKELLLPALKSVILSVNTNEKRIIAKPPLWS
ncbi:MAG: 16S rRNA processing protein RimM [Anaerolineaceae bacterium]|nr:16S rRNA processing protein RimM [Anaerolineaceae bacterium]